MTSILCVDDDPYLTDLLSYALTREGFAVRVAHSGADALRAVAAERPALVILDGNLPDASGFELCPVLRTTHGLPVIMLTARHTDEDVLHGFESGADDYVGKPFNMQLLVHRVRAVLRRTQPETLPAEPVDLPLPLGDGFYDAAQQEISGPCQRVKLTRTEAKILGLLLAHRGQVFSAERILERVWGYETDSDVAVIKTHIRRLRTKIAHALGDLGIIGTVPGLGYTVRRAAPDSAPTNRPSTAAPPPQAANSHLKSGH